MSTTSPFTSIQRDVLFGVEVFGTQKGLAEHLEVSRTQPRRWLDEAERPQAHTLRRIVDLGYIWHRLRLHLDEETARIWLTSPNRFLDDHTPLHWLKISGPARVIESFDGYLAGSYA